MSDELLSQTRKPIMPRGYISGSPANTETPGLFCAMHRLTIVAANDVTILPQHTSSSMCALHFNRTPLHNPQVRWIRDMR